MAFLGCKKLGVVGFDFGGSRFYNDNDRHAFGWTTDSRIADLDDPVYEVVNTWVSEWRAFHGMDIRSLVPPGESGLADILEAGPTLKK